MMKRVIVLGAVSAAVITTALVYAAESGAPAAPPVNYVDRDQFSADLTKGGTFLTGSDFILQANHREKTGNAEVHAKETDVIYVLEGDATFITGGKVIGGHEIRANQINGSGIEGGATHHLKKGDVITIAAGVPHWFKETSGVKYFVVKVVKP